MALLEERHVVPVLIPQGLKQKVLLGALSYHVPERKKLKTRIGSKMEEKQSEKWKAYGQATLVSRFGLEFPVVNKQQTEVSNRCWRKMREWSSHE